MGGKPAPDLQCEIWQNRDLCLRSRRVDHDSRKIQLIVIYYSCIPGTYEQSTRTCHIHERQLETSLYVCTYRTYSLYVYTLHDNTSGIIFFGVFIMYTVYFLSVLNFFLFPFFSFVLFRSFLIQCIWVVGVRVCCAGHIQYDGICIAYSLYCILMYSRISVVLLFL